LPETVTDNTLGFCLAHDMVDQEWIEQGPYGIEELALTYEMIEGECNNMILAMFDSSLSVANSFALKRDRAMATMYELVAMCQMAG
jgi:hypothetical protein